MREKRMKRGGASTLIAEIVLIGIVLLIVPLIATYLNQSVLSLGSFQPLKVQKALLYHVPSPTGTQTQLILEMQNVGSSNITLINISTTPSYNNLNNQVSTLSPGQIIDVEISISGYYSSVTYQLIYKYNGIQYTEQNVVTSS
jgi:hypothetical protein